MSGGWRRLRAARATALGLVTAATFVDLLAYSICVPVLPDLGTRLGASPTIIGLLFGSFGVTLLGVSIPMGAASDRLGRRGLFAGGLGLLAGATVLFAFAPGLAWLFAARLVQGAADAITWVVGFALIADLYGPAERGRAMGLVMAGTSLGLLAGPPIGGWLYELGGLRLPFLIVTGLAILAAIGVAALPAAPPHAGGPAASMARVLTVPAVGTCALVALAGSGMIAMLEPVLPLHLGARFGFGPGQVGLLFGIAAAAATVMHPVWGRLSDRWGGRGPMLAGLLLTALAVGLFPLGSSLGTFGSLMVLAWVSLGLVVTPSLSFMAEAAARAGLPAYGAVYGLYNVAWGAGLLLGPSLGGYLYEVGGLTLVSLTGAPTLLAVTVLLARRRVT